MSEVSEEPKFTLRVLIDQEKNNVILAEADREFVDVLYSLLTLPIATIVRLLENHRKHGCISNLYKSVLNMSIDHFETKACKEMLLNPRSVKEDQCKRLKLNLHSTNDHNKYFRCRSFASPGCSLCSSFRGSDCRCGKEMDIEIFKDQVSGSIQKDVVDGVFLRSRSSFIITDDLKVSVGSTDLVLKTLNRLGYADVSKLGEQFLHVGLKEIITLLEYMLSSSTPLTDTFLKKRSQYSMKRKHKVILSPFVEVKTEVAEPEFTVDAIVRKQDMKILYLECGEDFVDLLFTFLAVSLESVMEISGNIHTYGCIGNLFGSFKDLSVDHSASKKCVLPYFYKCKKQFSNIITEEPPVYYRYNVSETFCYCLTTESYRQVLHRRVNLIAVTVIDPKSHGRDQSENGSGFVKRETKFTVSDDLIITPCCPLSTSVGYLKKLQVKADDLVVQVIKIRKAEVMSLLRASLVTSSALSSALHDLIAKKQNEEGNLWNPS